RRRTVVHVGRCSGVGELQRRRWRSAAEGGLFGKRNWEGPALGDAVVEIAERPFAFFQEPVADAEDFQTPGEAGGGRRRPGAVAGYFSSGGGLRKIGAVLHEVDGFVERHVTDVQAGIDNDARGSEEGRFVLRHLLPWVGEKALLTHQLLRV